MDPLLALGQKDNGLRFQRVRVRQHIGHVVLGFLREDGFRAGCELHPQQAGGVHPHTGENEGCRPVPAEAVHARRHEILGRNVEPRLVVAGGQVAQMDDRAPSGVIATPPRTARSESMSHAAYPGLVSILSNAPVSRSRR